MYAGAAYAEQPRGERGGNSDEPIPFVRVGTLRHE
jgi:hypothetical protein